EARHLHVEERNVRLRLARQSDGLLAVACLGAHLEPDRFEHSPEVEPDDRLVLGDEDLGAHRNEATRSEEERESPEGAAPPPPMERFPIARRAHAQSGFLYISLTRSIRDLYGEDDPRPCRSAGLELERALQLVANERLHDRQTGARRRPTDTRAVVGDREHDVAVSPRELERDVSPAMLEGILEELREHERQSRRLLPCERDGREVGGDLLPRDKPLNEHRPQPVDELAEVDVVLAMHG